MKLHFVSTGEGFPYTYYIGVMTALKSYSGDTILWIDKEPVSKYFDLLRKQPGLEIRKAPEIDLNKYQTFRQLDPHTKLVTKFDYLIWKIVSEQGGIIAGLDSVTLKRWDDLLPKDKEMLVGRDAFEVKDSYAMHGVVVRKGSKIAKKIFKDIQGVLEGKELTGRHKAFLKGKMVWGGAGIIPYLNNVYNKKSIAIADPFLIAGINHDGQGFYIYQRNAKLIHSDTRTIPLYATSTHKKFSVIDEDFVLKSKTLYADLVRSQLKMSEWKPTYTQSVKKKMRFHLLGLAHLPVSERYMPCAFTQKILKLSKMLLSMGHEVFLYGAEGSDAPCTEFIQTHTLSDIRKAWGEGDNKFEIGYDWSKGFKNDFNMPKTDTTLKYLSMCILEINKRKKDDDFLLLSQGAYQRKIDQGVGLYLTCEPGVGYRGSYTKFRAFESSYLQNFTYGSANPFKSINGSYYDRVIPNYFDPKDFIFSKKKEDYYFYIGRMVMRKGVWTAVKATQAIGAKLILAGQADKEINANNLPEHCEFVGMVDAKKRSELMSKALATFVPTIYLEAFAGTHIESMLCGTPPITTNFGVFPETIPDFLDGKVGYRCNTLQDFVKAAEHAKSADYDFIRRYAARFEMDNVKWDFQRWFDDLYQLYLSTKDKNVKAWHHLS